jgi:hypothetical protein
MRPNPDEHIMNTNIRNLTEREIAFLKNVTGNPSFARAAVRNVHDFGKATASEHLSIMARVGRDVADSAINEALDFALGM